MRAVTLEGKQKINFTGRDIELSALVSRMRNGVNVVILSPRRFGKTSLLLRAESELAMTKPFPAIVRANVLRARDLTTLMTTLTNEVYRLRGARWHRARQGIPEFLRRLRLRPTMTLNDRGRPVFGFEPNLTAPDADTTLADLYALLDEEAEARPAVLVLDEFQAITDHGSHLPRLFKGLADQHPRVGLVMAGSKRHLMERLVSEEDAPLYGMAQKLALGPIPEAVMTRFLIDRASAGAKVLTPETAQRLLSLAGPVPDDIQRLAYEAYDLAGAEIDAAALAAGLDQARLPAAVTLYTSLRPASATYTFPEPSTATPVGLSMLTLVVDRAVVDGALPPPPAKRVRLPVGVSLSTSWSPESAM